MLKAKTILIISPEAWGPAKLSKHHYATYLSKHNDVYFLNPVTRSRWHPFSGIKFRTETLRERLRIVNYENLLPSLNKFPSFCQAIIYKRQARLLQAEMGIAEFDVVWSFDPYRYWNLRWFIGKQYIYHSVDFHPGAKFEERCCKSADVVIAVTNLIRNDLLVFSRNVHKISHGADIDGFNEVHPVNLPGKNKLKAMYVGNIHSEIDYDVLGRLANENTDVDFILIGPTGPSNLSNGNHIALAIKSKLEATGNIFFTGGVPSSEISSYLQLSDINLVLFKKHAEKNHSNSHKIMAYLYSGKITLATYLDEHQHEESEIIQIKTDPEEIREMFAKIKSNLSYWNSAELIEKRRSRALDNSYDSKISEIESILFSLKESAV